MLLLHMEGFVEIIVHVITAVNYSVE